MSFSRFSSWWYLRPRSRMWNQVTHSPAHSSEISVKLEPTSSFYAKAYCRNCMLIPQLCHSKRNSPSVINTACLTVPRLCVTLVGVILCHPLLGDIKRLSYLAFHSWFWQTLFIHPDLVVEESLAPIGAKHNSLYRNNGHSCPSNMCRAKHNLPEQGH